MFQSDRVLALDVGASKVVVAEFAVSKSSPIELLNYGIGYLDITPEGETDASAYIVSTIRDILREHSIKAAPLLMSLSGQAVFPRFVKLPPVTPDKIFQIVQYEAEQNVPFPIEEVVWDYQLIAGEDGEMSVMLVAVKIENVQKLTECVLAAGIEPEVVDVAPMALYNTVRYNYPDIEGCAMILDIGARSSNLVFIEGSRIFSRSIPVAGNAITQELAKEFNVSFAEAEELKIKHAFVSFGGVTAGPENETADRVSKIVRNVVTRLHAEVNRSINFYRSQQGGGVPSLVLLAGGTSVIPHMDTFFREKLKVTVEHLNPFINVAVGGNLDSEKVAGDMHLLGEVVGLGLRRSLTCPVEINLMPPALVAKKVFRKRQPYFGLIALGVALIMLCWWVYLSHMQGIMKIQFGIVEKKTQDLDTVLTHLQKVLAGKKKAQMKADEILSVIRLRTKWIEIMEDVYSRMPEGMWLNSLKPVPPSAGGTNQIMYIELKGSGFADKLVDKPEKSAIEDFRDKLRSSPYFTKNTEIKRQPAGESYVKQFEIWVALKEPLIIR
ncbi:MAG: type IV pilus assembly protein PilM [Kiritimatiellae bacterium]|nr:type IV pilus assembly protein PilM [Kiritimatiellia bacterium]